MSTIHDVGSIKLFHDLRAKTSGVDTGHLDALYDSLGTVAGHDLIGGLWKGGLFQTGHKSIRDLENMRWWGKEFASPQDVKPLLCLDDRGERYSNPKNGGEASLWNVEFRGRVSAAMVYDNVPIIDHFRMVDQRTVMGIMTGKDPSVLDNGKCLYFHLERA